MNTAAETTTMVNAIKAYEPLSKKVLLHGATAEMSYGYTNDTGILSPAGYIVETLAGAATTATTAASAAWCASRLFMVVSSSWSVVGLEVTLRASR